MKKYLKIILIICVMWLCTPFTVLVLGSDARSRESIKGSRSDGMVLVKVTPLLLKVRMVSIPRDTYAEIPCKLDKRDKITHAFAFGGTKCAKKSVEKLLDTKVNYTLVFRFSDVVEITNIMGGINIVANHTFTQDGYRFIKGEKYKIRGEQALAYTRHRKSDGAFKRDERQRQVINGIIKEAITGNGINKIPEIFSYGLKNMEMKINPLRILVAIPAVGIGSKFMSKDEIVGKGMMKNGVYYFVPEEKSLNKIKWKFKVFI